MDSSEHLGQISAEPWSQLSAAFASAHRGTPREKSLKERPCHELDSLSGREAKIDVSFSLQKLG